MLPVLFLLLALVPLAELWLLLRSADAIGIGPTLLLLLAVSGAGAWLLKREGLATWERLRASLRAGRAPAREAVDGALVLLGGALLLTPGFLTDAIGLSLLLPPARELVKTAARAGLARWARRRWGVAVIPARPAPRRGPGAGAGRRPAPPPAPGTPAAGEGGSRDTG